MLRDAGFSSARIETKDFTARKVHYIGYVALGEKEPGKLEKNTNA
jgi:hypothetical protein